MGNSNKTRPVPGRPVPGPVPAPAPNPYQVGYGHSPYASPGCQVFLHLLLKTLSLF